MEKNEIQNESIIAQENEEVIRVKLIKMYLLESHHRSAPPLAEFLTYIESEIIKKGLMICNFHMKNTSILLKLNYTTLLSKTKKYKIQLERRTIFEEYLT